MARLPRRHQAYENQTFNADTQSAFLPNLGLSNNPKVVMLVDVPNAGTGTTPTITVSLYGSLDGATKPALIGTATLIAQGGTGSNPQRTVFSDVLEPFVQVSVAIGGSGSPQFTGVNIDLLFPSPDF